MTRATEAKFKQSLLFSILLGGILLSSCGAASDRSESAPQQALMPSPAAEAPTGDSRGISNKVTGVSGDVALAAQEVPASLPQLVKKAEIALRVNSVEKTIRAVSNIIQQQQGDLLGLEDRKPLEESTYRNASMQMRVPQNKLENTLDKLAELGTVERRTLSAEDVSNQLVDYEARLRNLRKQETMLLKIMERSGSIPDVLRVTQELSLVRQQIEQIDAQLSNLKNRVAYSTITLTLEEAIANRVPERSVGLQVQESWNEATTSVVALTADLLKMGIWLLAFSPYLLVITGAVYFGYTRFRQRQSPAPETENPG